MAENLVDGEFWLPPQFLTDDDGGDGYASFNKKKNAQNDDVFDTVMKSLLPHLSSEEDHLAELTRRVALYLAFQNSKPKPKGAFGGGSPQSTLSEFGSSGKGSSPNGAVSLTNDSSSTFDLLRAAAGEVERMRLGKEDHRRYGCNFNNAPKNAAAVNSNGVTGSGFYNSQQHLQQLQIAQFQMMMRHQQQRQMVQNRGRNSDTINSNNVRVANNLGFGLSNSSTWPHGSGMRAVLVAGKRESKSTGTGVFLPRVHEAREKPACNTTVLVPARVAQALNLNIEGGYLKNHNHYHQHKPRLNNENGSAVTWVKGNNNIGYSYQKWNNNFKPQQPHVVNQEIQLPQEWTY